MSVLMFQKNNRAIFKLLSQADFHGHKGKWKHLMSEEGQQVISCPFSSEQRL